jgi:Phage Tail Collar Domain
MSSTTPNIGLLLPDSGEFPGTWDINAANPNFTLIDTAFGQLNGQLSAPFTVNVTNTDVTLTQEQAQYFGLSITGTLSANVVINYPATAGGFRMIWVSAVTFGTYAIAIRNPTDSIGVCFYVPIREPRAIVINPNGRIFWADYGAAPVGTVVDCADTQTPPGWLRCDGSMANATQYDLLYSIIGTLFGPTSGSGDNLLFQLPTYAGTDTKLPNKIIRC